MIFTAQLKEYNNEEKEEDTYKTETGVIIY